MSIQHKVEINIQFKFFNKEKRGSSSCIKGEVY